MTAEKLTRRRFVAGAVGTGAVGATSGCLGGAPPSDGSDHDGSSPDESTNEPSLFQRVELVDTEIVARLDGGLADDVDAIELVTPDGTVEEVDWYGGSSLKVRLTDYAGAVQRPPGEYALRAVTEFDELVEEYALSLERSLEPIEFGTYRQLGVETDSDAAAAVGFRASLRNEGPMPVSVFQAGLADPEHENPILSTQHGTAVLEGDAVAIDNHRQFRFRSRSGAESRRGERERDLVFKFHDGTQHRIPVVVRYAGDVEYHSAGFITEYYYFSEMAVEPLSG